MYGGDGRMDLWMGERGSAYRALVRKPEEKRPLGRPRCRWEDSHSHSHSHLFHIPLILYRCGTSHIYI